MDTKQNEFRPAQGAAPFEQGEVFYSRTDKRGVIQSGNYIFRRVADYDWGELLGAPHKKIRHPDTERWRNARRQRRMDYRAGRRDGI